MLVYIRKSELSSVLMDVPEDDIPEDLKRTLEEESHQDQMRKNAKAEAHLFANIYLLDQQALQSHQVNALRSKRQALTHSNAGRRLL